MIFSTKIDIKNAFKNRSLNEWQIWRVRDDESLLQYIANFEINFYLCKDIYTLFFITKTTTDNRVIMNRFLLLLSALFLFAVGCQSDATTENAVAVGGGATLTVSLSQTRTSLGGKVDGTYPVYWSEGDKIVVDGKLSEEVVIDTKDNSRATFSVAAGFSYPCSITYPYCETTSAEQAVVEFLAEQTYTEGSFAQGSMPMCGYMASKSNSVTLSHLACVLRFPVKAKFEGTVLEKIVVTSTEQIAGEFNVDCQAATISATEGCGNNIIYTLPTNHTLSTTAESVFHIVLPAVNVGSCTIEFVETSGEKMVATWTPNKVLTKGSVREFKTITYEPKAKTSLQPLVVEEDSFILLKKYANLGESKIMSFNIRTATTETDSANNWDNRKEACVELIIDQKPGIIGFQEARYSSQWVYLKEQLADYYDGYGVNRDTGAESGTGEVMGIMYCRNIIEKIDGGTFWLSETPDEASIGWDAAHYRTATWGLFKHLPTGVIFYYINTHLDNKGTEARVEGMKVISRHFEEYKETYPLFLTGDLNVKSDNEAIDPIESYMFNARENAPASFSDFNTTYNGYQTNKSSIIDHIYCSNNLKVAEYHTINENYGDVEFVSDHYPIYAIVELK